jgi:capsular exopolysaccharide synthesis family protein
MSRLDEALSRARTFTPGESAGAVPIEGAALDFPVEDVAAPAAEVAPLPLPPAIVPMEEPFPGDSENVIEARGRIEDSPIAEKLMLAGEHGGTRAPVEQYRRLAARLLLAQAEHGIRTVMITSPLPGEGKTLTAANLALTLSESYKRQVLLVDADLRRPCVHQVFEVPNASGLNDGLKGDNDRKVPLLRFSDQLTLLTAGRPDPDPMSVLSGSRMKRVLAEARERFDCVLIDTPPITLLTDAHLMSTLVDAVVLVVRAGATPLPAIQKAVEAIGQDRILGIVLNHAEISQIPETYSYYAAHSERSGA